MLIRWISDVYTKHGYIAALVTIVTVVILAGALAWAFGVDIKQIAIWLYQLG